VLAILLLGQVTLFVVSLSSLNRVAEAVRNSGSQIEVQDSLLETLRRVSNSLSKSLLIISSVMLVVVLFTFLRVKRYFRRIDAETRKMMSDDYRFLLPGSEWIETRGIVELINALTQQLDERIQLDSQAKSQERAILASMIEGVLAIDTRRRIINLNEAAATLFHVSVDRALGRRVEEVVRISAVLEFIQSIFDEKKPVIRTLQLYEEKERYLRAHGSRLFDSSGEDIGALVVLFDITRMHQLEMIRKEFAANVSHELKTPITGIKGFVETLHDGQIDDPSEVKRYLDIIAKQTDRLAAIIDDLLALARIEQDIERDNIALARAPLLPVLEASVQAYAEPAKRKTITVDIDSDESIQANINTQLLEQAIGNLIDNAIKYSESNSVITVSARKFGEEIAISVRDQGCGIEARHLPRLFERFYRVDKARSRNLGGTGLGLAIVKHISLSHHGNVEVQSAPGEGSIFTIRFPA
jgi:two-component system phosphate regulon sensor histidine kinase PhoR